LATEVTRPVDEDFEIKYQFYNPYNFLLVKDSESSVTLSGTWGWFSYDGEVYYGDNLKIYGPSIHRVNGESYAYEMHLRGTTLQNYQKILVVFFESDDYDSHNEIMDALGFWGNSVEMMEIGQEKEITQMIDMHASFGYGNTQFLEYTGKDFSGDCQDIDYIVSATTISISPHQSYAFGLDTFAYYPTRDMTYETQIFQNWEPIVESQPPVKPPVTPMTTPQPATSGSIPHPINPVAPNNIKPPPASLVDPRVAAQKPLPSGPASPPTKPVTPAHPNTPFSPYEVPKTQLPSNYSQPIIDQGKPIPATQPIIPTTNRHSLRRRPYLSSFQRRSRKRQYHLLLSKQLNLHFRQLNHIQLSSQFLRSLRAILQRRSPREQFLHQFSRQSLNLWQPNLSQSDLNRSDLKRLQKHNSNLGSNQFHNLNQFRSLQLHSSLDLSLSSSQLLCLRCTRSNYLLRRSNLSLLNLPNLIQCLCLLTTRRLMSSKRSSRRTKGRER
jgi:carbonic anhydrase